MYAFHIQLSHSHENIPKRFTPIIKFKSMSSVKWKNIIFCAAGLRSNDIMSPDCKACHFSWPLIALKLFDPVLLIINFNYRYFFVIMTKCFLIIAPSKSPVNPLFACCSTCGKAFLWNSVSTGINISSLIATVWQSSARLFSISDEKNVLIYKYVSTLHSKPSR